MVLSSSAQCGANAARILGRKQRAADSLSAELYAHAAR